jgi:cell wall-associated NlpC family hydrolase
MPSLFALVVITCVAATAVTAATAADRPGTPPSAVSVWAAQEIATVVQRGLLGPSVEKFRPDDPLTWGELADALAEWGHPIAPPADPARAVTIRDLDARLVAALGLLSASRAIRVAAHDAGLNPITSLGTETVARIVGLRLNHPAAQDRLELLPAQPASRAEAAYSLARAMTVLDWQKEQVLNETTGLSFPDLTTWQRTVLTRALRFVGQPYVFSGTSERTRQTLWDGTVVPGGFDCSGFVWRVYKLQPFPDAPELTRTLQGRTTYAMSGEVPTELRVPVAAVEPADVVFFGSRGIRSKPSEIEHMGIYVGNGWFVHSSEHGVTLDPMMGYYQTRFAWARRPLAEAGLDRAGGAEPSTDPVSQT